MQKTGIGTWCFPDMITCTKLQIVMVCYFHFQRGKRLRPTRRISQPSVSVACKTLKYTAMTSRQSRPCSCSRYAACSAAADPSWSSCSGMQLPARDAKYLIHFIAPDMNMRSIDSLLRKTLSNASPHSLLLQYSSARAFNEHSVITGHGYIRTAHRLDSWQLGLPKTHQALHRPHQQRLAADAVSHGVQNCPEKGLTDPRIMM